MRKRETKPEKKTNNHPMLDRSGFIQNLFREFPNNKFSLKQLASASGGNTRDGRRITREVVEDLLAERIIEECGREKYRLSSRERPRLEGEVVTHAGGAIYLHCEAFEEDVYISSRNAANALHGDRVEFVVTRQSAHRGTIEGEITRILARNPRPYAGVAEVGAHQIFVRIDSRRMPVDVFLPKKRYPEVEDGDKVVVRIVDWAPGTNSPVGELVDVLGKSGENDAEMHAILAEYDLPYRFETEVEEAAEKISGRISAREIATRRDFRTVTTFTIDPADAKDFDDALSVRRLENGLWEVGVHIADVTHYVTPGSVIDCEAQERGTSVYLVDRTIPMLPERLCNALCSLRPDEESLCFSAVFTLNEKAEVLDRWFGRTVIHSDRRFTYAEAQEVIERGRGDFAEEILTLHRLAQTLRKERFRRGAIAFDRDEPKFELDEKGRPLGVYFKESKESNQLIEEFMLLANREVAEFCAKRIGKNGRASARTMVFRVHDLPSEEKLDRFRSFILRFGHLFRATKGRAIAKEMNKLFQEIKGRAEENVVSMLAVRAMAKAFYTTDNIGHYGLAFPYYTHFTSPIRRYPDMMVHRLLAHYLADGLSVPKEEIEGRCVHASEREIIAAEAERASIKYKMVEFMRDKVGQEFEGRISGMNERLLFVELIDTRIEGACFLRDLPGDYYQFDEERYEVYGRTRGGVYTLGDPIRVRVKTADLRRRLLDFEAVTMPDGRRYEEYADRSPRIGRQTTKRSKR